MTEPVQKASERKRTSRDNGVSSRLEGVPLLLPDHGLLVHVVDAGTLVLHSENDGDVRYRALQQSVTQLTPAMERQKMR